MKPRHPHGRAHTPTRKIYQHIRREAKAQRTSSDQRRHRVSTRQDPHMLAHEVVPAALSSPDLSAIRSLHGEEEPSTGAGFTSLSNVETYNHLEVLGSSCTMRWSRWRSTSIMEGWVDVGGEEEGRMEAPPPPAIGGNGEGVGRYSRAPLAHPYRSATGKERSSCFCTLLIRKKI
jgi:hypothetical protein